MKSLPAQLEFTALVAEVPDSSMEAKAAKRARARAFAKLRREKRAAERRREKKLVELLIQLGLSHHYNGDYEKSVEPCLSALELDPTQTFLREHLVTAYIRLEDYDSAQDHLIDALRDNPEEAWAHIGLAVYYAKAESNIELARQLLNRALEIDPTSVQAHNQLGSLHHDAERFDEALGHFNHSVLHQPENAYGHYGRIIAYLALGSLREAQSALDIFVEEVDPEVPETLLLLKDAQAALLHYKGRTY